MFQNIPEKVEYILGQLQAAGFEAYAVGGCVRDTLLSKEPKDWDITTSAEPEETKALFRRTVDTGIKHGTITVMLGDEGFEVTTYRLDGEYEDSRHPKTVTFTKCLSEDLLRRDFTINAMAYNPKDGLVDLFDGQKDLQNKLIRCVGNPYERFSEDALRILRSFRFSARLGFEIEPETEKAAKELAHTLTKISAERIREELSKLLISPRPEKFSKLEKMGILKVILPEIDGVFKKSKRTDSILLGIAKSLENADFNEHDAIAFAWGVVISATVKTDIPTERKAFASKIMHDLKFDNDTIRLTSSLVEHSIAELPDSEEKVRKYISTMSRRLYDMWLLFLDGDRFYDRKKPGKKKLEKLYALSREVYESGCCLSLKELAVSGKDLLDAGFPSGTGIGACLDYLLDRVLEKPENNNKEMLLKLAGEFFESCETV